MEVGTIKVDNGILSIPEGWEVLSIRDLMERKAIIGHLDGNHGALYPRSEEFKPSGVPYIAANDFIGGVVDFKNCKHVSPERAKLFQKGVSISGDVLFAHNATVGPVALLSTKLPFVILSTTATYFRCDNSRLLNRYLLYALQAGYFVTQYQAVMAQSTRFQVPITAQRKFKIALPTKAEQTAIATALSDTDALISSLEKLIAKKRNIKQGVMQELLRPKEGWELKQLGEVLRVRHGKSQKAVENRSGKNPILGTGGIMGWTDYHLCNGESVLIGRKGTIDKPQYMDKPFWTVDTLFYTEVSSKYSAKFIYYNFLMIDWYSYNEASGVPSLSAKTIEKITIYFPKSLQEQMTIARILDDIALEIKALEQKRDKCNDVKAAMMQSLLTGKIRLI